jgi:hypothetical protein
MRPQIHPYVPIVWRDADTLQIGIPPAPSSLVVDADVDLFQFIQRLDGRLTTEQLLTLPNCPTQIHLNQIFDALAHAHALIDADSNYPLAPRISQEFRERTIWQTLAQDLAHPSCDSGAKAVAARADSYVLVHGANQLAFAITHLLATAGIGRLVIDQPEHLGVKVTPDSIIGLGPGWPQLGQPALLATRDLAKRFGAEVTRPKGLANPDFEVFTSWPDVFERDRVNAEQIAHMVVTTEGCSATAGPLVVPGVSACLRCVELGQQIHDPAWGHTHLQSQARRSSRETPCDNLLTSWAAVMAAMSTVAYLEANPDGALGLLVGQRLFATAPGPQISAEAVALQPSCGCI